VKPTTAHIALACLYYFFFSFSFFLKKLPQVQVQRFLCKNGTPYGSNAVDTAFESQKATFTKI